MPIRSQFSLLCMSTTSWRSNLGLHVSFSGPLLFSPTVSYPLARDPLLFSLMKPLSKDLNPFLWLNSSLSPHLAHFYILTSCVWRCLMSKTNETITIAIDIKGRKTVFIGHLLYDVQQLSCYLIITRSKIIYILNID